MTQYRNLLLQISKDPFIWISVCAAMLFWFLLSMYVPVTVNVMWPIVSPMAFIIPVVLYPVLEEIVFRGMVLEYCQKKIPGVILFHISKANFFTSILFTALHFIYHPPLWASAVFIPSLIFGFLKERHQSLIAPILIHVFFNAGYYWLFTNLT